MSESQELEESLVAKRELESLLDSSAFQRVIGILQEQVDALQREVLFTPCTSVDSALGQEYKKGQIDGRLSITTVIEAEIASLTVGIHNLRRNQDADGNGSGANAEPNGAP